MSETNETLVRSMIDRLEKQLPNLREAVRMERQYAAEAEARVVQNETSIREAETNISFLKSLLPAAPETTPAE